MQPSHRKLHPEPSIVPTVIAAKSASWGRETNRVAEADAQRVLEALIAEVGVEATVVAMNKQGFQGKAYRYLLVPLHAEAVERRARAAGPRRASCDAPVHNESLQQTSR